MGFFFFQVEGLSVEDDKQLPGRSRRSLPHLFIDALSPPSQVKGFHNPTACMSNVLASASEISAVSPGTPNSAASDSASSSPSLSPIPTPSAEHRSMRMQRHSTGMLPSSGNGFTTPTAYTSPLVASVAATTSPCPSPTMSDAGSHSKRAALVGIARPRPRAISTGQMKMAQPGIPPPASRSNCQSPLPPGAHTPQRAATPTPPHSLHPSLSSPLQTSPLSSTGSASSIPSSSTHSAQQWLQPATAPLINLLDMPTGESDPKTILLPMNQPSLPTSPSYQELEKEFLH